MTSRKQTSRILKSRGHRGLRRYDSGGTVPMGPITVNVNTAVIGNQFEVARRVVQSVQTGIRLRGTRA